MASNPLQNRLNYVQAKFKAAKGNGITASSGAVVGSARTPVPIIRRASILLTPYAFSRGRISIMGDSIPFYNGGPSFDMGENGGILGAVINRLEPLGLRHFPTFKQDTTPASSPASSNTSSNVGFYGSVQPQTPS
ncbi:MAG: hypothetical protein M1431_03065 [Candidatus Thermoplasmatota archaeon]|nr:hypothetical protein [Candidatus Thermoplasmatota archaeon]